MIRRWLLLTPLALGLGACLEFPDFPRSSLVTGPRVLAIVTDPPEVNPGRDLELSVMVASASAIDVRYVICGAFEGFLGGGGQFGEQDEDDCSGQPAFLEGRGEGPDGRWRVPGVLAQAVWANVDLGETVLGDALPARTIQLIRASVGLPVLVQASVDVGGREIRAVKRVLLSENPAPHTNPPRPEFRFGRTDVRALPDSSWACAPSDGSTLIVAKPGAEIEIAPAVSSETETESWFEEYKVINARGELLTRTERAYYSWYATGGDFDQQITRSPLRNQLWTAPKEPDCHRLWLVVRDGHGGTSACGVDVAVGSNAEWPSPTSCERHAGPDALPCCPER